MKTLTELSGILVRKAAAAIAEAKRTLPKAAPAVVEAPPPAPVEAAPAPVEGEAAAAPAAEGEAAAPAAPAPASPPKAKGPPAEVPETEEVKAILDAAVTAATGLSGDRLARLRDAVEVTGRRIDDVRLVRVFGPDEPVPGAATRNGFQYVVDLAPASLRQVTEPKRDRGGRGGRGGGGGGGGGAGGGGGKGAPKSGGFSMDAMKDDRKGQRSGPGGGGRGGRPPGGGGGKPR